MKRINVIVAAIGIIALIAGVMYVTRPAPVATSRFAPMAPNGDGITAGGSVVSSGKGSSDQEEVVVALKNDVF